MNENKRWTILFLCSMVLFLIIFAVPTVIVDPYFHYHAPLEQFYYELDNQRSQNDGILKYFDYDAIITGTSMTENFKASELDELFGVKSVKTCFSGGSYKEINDNLRTALEHNDNIRMIVRGLDLDYFFKYKNIMRNDLGEYPTYLYDDNIWNDVKYLFNKEVLWERSWPSLINCCKGEPGGITSFDVYSNWMENTYFARDGVMRNLTPYTEPLETKSLTEEDKQILYENFEQNVIRLAKDYPDTTFYYYFTPYSIAWWGEQWKNGDLTRRIEAEKYVIELLLECDNIMLFSFNNDFETISNLNNYKDTIHHGDWINSKILQDMRDEKFLLTQDNYMNYLEELTEYMDSFDYRGLFF